MKLVHVDDVRDWYARSDTLSQCLGSIGRSATEDEYIERALAMPLHLLFAISHMRRQTGYEVPADAFDSLPFYSLCKGLFLPLSAMTRQRAGQIFGIDVDEPPDWHKRQSLIDSFIKRDIGLSFPQRMACLLGDPFHGGRGGFRRDSLMRFLHCTDLWRRRELLDKLASVGDIAILYAQSRTFLKVEPPLTASEVLSALRFLPGAGRTIQNRVLTSLLERCGKLEAYFLAKLLLRKAEFGLGYDSEAVAGLISGHYAAEPGQVAGAIALTETFAVLEMLEKDGPEFLRKVTLQPLVAVKPALASGVVDEIRSFPVWVERKYDGIRLTLHKATDSRGSVLFGAYTRNRNDWIEMAPGLTTLLKALPAHSAIIDGELYGMAMDLDSVRPASVYEVYSTLHGSAARPVSLRFAAFDLLYLNGADVTNQPLMARRSLLTNIVGPLAGLSLPIPIAIADGQLAANIADVNKLFHHFRAQGHEGIVAKDPNGPYRLGVRDPSWLKRKPEITLDLALIGAVLAVTAKTNSGRFGSYVIAARDTTGAFVDVGDVAGVDSEGDLRIQQEIFRDGLLTGRQIERQSASGVRPGYELRPSIVVTVRFEGVMRESGAGKLSLRDPKIIAIRSDKPVSETDHVSALEEIYLKQRIA